MTVLGLLLILLAILVVVVVMLNGGDSAQLSLEWLTADTNVAGIFIAGAATVLVGVVGASLLLSGLKRSRRKRAEVKALKARAAKAPKVDREPATPPRASQSGQTSNSSSTGATPTSSPTTVERRSDDDPDGTDEHFQTTPRDR